MTAPPRRVALWRQTERAPGCSPAMPKLTIRSGWIRTIASSKLSLSSLPPVATVSARPRISIIRDFHGHVPGQVRVGRAGDAAGHSRVGLVDQAVAQGVVGVDRPAEQVGVELLDFLGVSLGDDLPAHDRLAHGSSLFAVI